MKQLLTALLLLLWPSRSPVANYYTTNFPLAENPISENCKWIKGKDVGIDWANVRSTPGLAYGTEMDKVEYGDSTAILAGTWGPNQVAQAQVHTFNQNSSMFEEVELRLRTSISAHSITGYEINFRCIADGSQYVQIVRWNGSLGNFNYLANLKGPGMRNGGTLKATIIGSIITVYINGTQVTTDNKFTAGSPGMGYYIEGGRASQQGDYGFTSFSASDTLGLGTVSQSSTIDWRQAEIPGGISNRTSAFPCIAANSEVISTLPCAIASGLPERVLSPGAEAFNLASKPLWLGRSDLTLCGQCAHST